jgi:hypothetical protein
VRDHQQHDGEPDCDCRKQEPSAPMPTLDHL